MLPPHPQLSLPTPQNFTRHGSALPFCFLRSVIVLSASEFKYSTHFAISSTVPLPTFAAIYGSQPINEHNSRNSCVPKLLSSDTPPQFVFTICGLSLLRPMPSLQ